MNNLLAEMKRIADEARRSGHSPEIIRVELKEYLQYFVLDFLYNSKFKNLIFYGGSCLRILHELPRMSEDLDFEAEEGRVDFHALSKGLEAHFKSDLLMKKIKIAPNKEKKIMRILLIFPIANELGLSPHQEETIKIKIEIRLVSPGYFTKTKGILTPLSKYGKTFVVKHYDLGALMATKLAAILERPEKGFYKGRPNEGIQFKGRDFYDLLWYMEKGVRPSEKMLQANGITETIEEIFDKISIQITKMDIKGIQKDIENLFATPHYTKEWIRTFRANFSRLREKRYRSKKNLSLDEIFIGQDFESGRFLFRFDFLSETGDIVTFFFHVSSHFIRFKKREGRVQSRLSGKDAGHVVFWKTVSEEDKNQLFSYAAIFLEKLRRYIKRNKNGVYFEKWESKLIQMSGDNPNPANEIIFLYGKELESKTLILEDLGR